MLNQASTRRPDRAGRAAGAAGPAAAKLPIRRDSSINRSTGLRPGAVVAPREPAAGLEWKFHERVRTKCLSEPYFPRVLRTWWIFLRVPTVTFASGTVAGSANFSAANSCFWRALGSGTWRATTWPLYGWSSCMTHSFSSSRKPSSTVTSSAHKARSRWRRTSKASIEVRAWAWVLSSVRANHGRNSKCPVLSVRKSRSTKARSS
jgi:hypothetical protein